MKVNKKLIAGIAAGAIAGAYIASHKEEIKEKIKGVSETIKDAGNVKLMQAQIIADGIKNDVVAHVKDAVKKITVSVK